MIHLTGEGDALITASQAGDDDYNAATAVDQLLEVVIVTGIEYPFIPDRTLLFTCQGNGSILKQKAVPGPGQSVL